MEQEFVPGNKIKSLYYKIVSILYYSLENIIPSHIDDYKDIPIIINNFNRLETLKKLILSLETRGYLNIYIIDNLSTYPPLIEYYKTCRYTIFRLEKNMGPDALWASSIYKKFKNDFFVYTDSDIVPIVECPDDFLLFFLNTLKENKLARKVGFSLKIDDIPDSNLLKKYIIKCEEHFFHDFKKGNLLYRAPIDTTFALYRPRGKRRHANNSIEMYRTGYPYLARHLPWYTDSKNPDAEEKYYLEHLEMKTFWTSKSKKLFEDRKKNDPGSFLNSDDALFERTV
jgi:hypothetical protein